MKKSFLFVLLAVMMLSCAMMLAACGQDEPAAVGELDVPSTDKYTIRLNHPNNTSHPYNVGAEVFKEKVEEHTNGNVTVEIYPSNQLGGPAATVQGIQLGTIDAGIVASSHLTSYSPMFNVFDLPYLFVDRETAYVKLDSEAGDKIAATVEDKNIKVLGYFDGGYRVMFNSKHEADELADFANMQIRVMESDIYINLIKAFNAMSTTIAWEDVYTSLQQGVIDAAECGITQVYTNKFYEVAPYISITNHTYTCAPLIMSKDLFDGMPADYQQAVLKAAEEAVKAERESIIAQDEESIKLIEAEGATISYPDVEELKAACETVWEAFAEKFGQDLIDIFAD